MITREYYHQAGLIHVRQLEECIVKMQASKLPDRLDWKND